MSSGRGGGRTEVRDAPSVLLVGNPNVGKSTLFNSVTGARQQVTNAPGTTVELQVGVWRKARTDGAPVRLIDLPGTYSLLARSPDERVAAEAVAGTGPLGAADLAVVLVEAAGLSRSLYLLAQVAQAGCPLVVALTMTDVAASRGIPVDADRLAEVLGVPVVAVDPRTGDGVSTLTRTVEAALTEPSRVRGVEPAAASADADVAAGLARAEALFGWVDEVTRQLAAPEPQARTASDRVDGVLLRPWVGVPVFLAVAWLLFQLATSLAAPLMDAVANFVAGPMSDAARFLIPGPAWLQGFVVDGLLAGVGTVLSFAPLMAVMFLAIALLEDCGYLARAAFVADRAMRALGLDGRAVLPLVVGFGCNLPALAATRTLPHARQRLLTGLLVPYASCTARLTVYLLLASIFFPDNAGTAIFVMYVASVALIVLGGLALRRTAFRDLKQEPFVLVLPAYQRPRVRALLLSAWLRTRAFVSKAGRVIMVTLAAVWVLLAIPVTGGHTVGDVPVQDSLYGSTAQAIAPALAPAGFGEWHSAAALVTGFVAKEVVVGSFAQTYAVDEPSDPTQAGDLGAQMRATFEETSGGHAAAAAAAFMVFVLAYTPCVATLAEQKRLFGARWTGGAMLVQLAVAWMLAVAVFQVGRLL
ncbi:ferrous iron transporter B [Cellulomonas cellasea]|uniref:ferrous iron transporter B n=1 Tax=Cellulomonas cellasea TaxID=43670 RepID=UPI0025A4ACF6|nr:ferrous iron transporter B [Cellulomonas cellasea]MDM8083523.1 ferrous iron transporter B [Cellulomonas cellasea]